jgi:chromate reductase
MLALGASAHEENNMDRTGEIVRVVGISGSLRKASFSTSLLKVLAEQAAPAIDLRVVTLENIPLYNEDLDRTPGIPSVAAFKKIIAESDGVLITTPEYNHGVPGVLKNALDWASRPVFDLFQEQTSVNHQFVEGVHRRRPGSVPNCERH